MTQCYYSQLIQLAVCITVVFSSGNSHDVEYEQGVFRIDDLILTSLHQHQEYQDNPTSHWLTCITLCCIDVLTGIDHHDGNN